jgi:hypothetical protein
MAKTSCGFSQSFKAGIRIVPQIRPWGDSYASEVASYRLDDQGLILDSGMVSLFATTVERLEMQSAFHLVLRIFFPCTEMITV